MWKFSASISQPQCVNDSCSLPLKPRDKLSSSADPNILVFPLSAEDTCLLWLKWLVDTERRFIATELLSGSIDLEFDRGSVDDPVTSRTLTADRRNGVPNADALGGATTFMLRGPDKLGAIEPEYDMQHRYQHAHWHVQHDRTNKRLANTN